MKIFADEVAIKTTMRRVKTAANPKRQSLVHQEKPKKAPKTTPNIIKKPQNTQPNRDNANVLRRINILSVFMINMLIIVSTIMVMIKSAVPSAKLALKPWIVLNKVKVESPTIPMQITATTIRALL